jgi:hypothetical protein
MKLTTFHGGPFDCHATTKDFTGKVIHVTVLEATFDPATNSPANIRCGVYQPTPNDSSKLEWKSIP